MSPPSDDWTTVTVHCVKDAADRQPAVAFTVGLRGEPVRENERTTVWRETNDAGEAVFDRVRTGSYDLEVITPWGHSFDREFVALPSRNNLEQVICPPEAPAAVAVRCNFKWPDDLRDRGLQIECCLQPAELDCDQIEVSKRLWKWGEITRTTRDDLRQVESVVSMSLRPGIAVLRSSSDGMMVIKHVEDPDDATYDLQFNEFTGRTPLLSNRFGLPAVAVSLLPGRYECWRNAILTTSHGDARDDATLLAAECAKSNSSGVRTSPALPGSLRARMDGDNTWQIDLPEGLWIEARQKLTGSDRAAPGTTTGIMPYPTSPNSSTRP